MSAAPPRAIAESNSEETPGSYAGWYIGLAIIVAVLAIGMALWFDYHP